MADDVQPAFEMERSLEDPDPSLRTMEALRRDIKAAADIQNEKFAAQDKLAWLKEAHRKEVSILDAEIQRLNFALRDTAGDKLALQNQKEITAALQAQKEIFGLSNTFMTTLVQMMNESSTKLIDVVVGKLDELRGRMDRGEGHGRGEHDNRTERRSDVGMIVGVVTVSVVVLTAVISGIIFVMQGAAK